MDRQCRICLDTENPETMVSPCMCRGTAAYIHEACLQRYFEFYPDGYCRVCNYSMCVPSAKHILDIVIFGLMVSWLVLLLFLSPIPGHFKILYFFMLISVLSLSQLTTNLRSVICLGLMLVSSIFAMLSTAHAVQFTLLFGLLASIGVMFLYIPAEMMLIFVTILLAGSYSTMMVVFFTLNQDAYLTGFFVPILILLWMCVIRARPPLRR